MKYYDSCFFTLKCSVGFTLIFLITYSFFRSSYLQNNDVSEPGQQFAIMTPRRAPTKEPIWRYQDQLCLGLARRLLCVTCFTRSYPPKTKRKAKSGFVWLYGFVCALVVSRRERRKKNGTKTSLHRCAMGVQRGDLMLRVPSVLTFCCFRRLWMTVPSGGGSRVARRHFYECWFFSSLFCLCTC